MSPTFTKGLLKGAALAIAGAAALGAGSAKAVDFSCTVTLGTLGACAGGTVNGFTFSNISLTGLGGTSLGGFVNFTSETATAPLSKVTVAFNRTSGSANIGTVNGALTFDVQKPFLIGYETATVFSSGSGTFDFSGTNILPASGVSFNSALNGMINLPLASTGTYSLEFDKTSVAGTIFNAGTTIVADVPVPLPVVGAGLAFGFTRRLRKRAKSVA